VRRTFRCDRKLLSPKRRRAAKRTSRCNGPWWFCRIDSGFPSGEPAGWRAKTAIPSGALCNWQTSRSRSCAVGSVSWRGAMCAGAAPAHGSDCGLMAGVAITSECSESGVREGSKDPCLAGASARGLPVTAGSCCVLNTLTRSGRLTSSSTRRWTAAPSSS